VTIEVAEVSGFANLIQFLTGADAFTLVFPFLISWMLYYAALDRVALFKDTDLDNAPPVIGIILAFFTARFLVMQPFYQNFFSIFFGKIVIALVTLLGAYSLLAFTGHNITDDDEDLVKYFAVASVGAAFLWAGGFGPWMTQGGSSGIVEVASQVVAWSLETGAIWLVVIGATMAAVMTMGNEDGGGPDPETDDGPN
jgi:hypothetical protein